MKQRHLAIAEPDIVEHAKRGSEAELLRHERDAELLGMLRVGDLGRLTVDKKNAAVGAIHAGNDLDQRAFARSVLAADRANLLGIQRQGDVPENLIRAEPLGEPFDCEDGH